MKKIALFIATAAIAVSASAQRATTSAYKTGDNWYMGVKATAMMPTVKRDVDGSMVSTTDLLDAGLGIRLGKNLNTVFGLAAEADFTKTLKSEYGTKTFVTSLDANLLTTWNLSNLFLGYNGTPRTFEVSALAGLGWGHNFGEDVKANDVHSKVALNLALNLGEAKAWQIYAEPFLRYQLGYWVGGVSSVPLKHNLKNAYVGVSLGVNYKFGCSNGTHNFAIEQLRDQSEIDALNASINSLRGELSGKDAQIAAANQRIAELQKALTDCQNKPAAPTVIEKKVANLQPSVVFQVGKSVVDNSQLANIEMIAKYMKNNPTAKVKVSGYASPEGSPELNQRLSEKRAEAVKDILVKKYKIAADRIEAEGLGATDKLFDQVEFNRVALFNDTTK